MELFEHVSVLEGALGGALCVDGGWRPLPTRPQQYCDPRVTRLYWHNCRFFMSGISEACANVVILVGVYKNMCKHCKDKTTDFGKGNSVAGYVRSFT